MLELAPLNGAAPKLGGETCIAVSAVIAGGAAARGLAPAPVVI